MKFILLLFAYGEDEMLLYQALKHPTMTEFINEYYLYAQLCMLLLSTHYVLTDMEFEVGRLLKTF